MNNKTFCILSVLLLTALNAFSLDIYISPLGNDHDSGTRTKPLASLLGARNHIRELRKKNITDAIKVIIMDGSYFMSEPLILTEEDSGTDNAQIVYTAEAGTHPVFYGGAQIKGFQKVNDKLWKAYVPVVARFGWNFEQLYINGNRATRARYPNTGFFHPKSVQEFVIQQGGDKRPELAVQKIVLHPEQLVLLKKLSKEELNNAVFTFYHNWDNTRKKTVEFSVSDSAFYIVGQGMKYWNKLDAMTRFTIENVKAALDTLGEWYLENTGYLYYVPKPGETLTNINCLAPVNDHFILMSGTKNKKIENIRFENLSFQVTGYHMPETGNEPMQAAASIDASIMVNYAQHIRFLNCEIAHTGSNAIWFNTACHNNQVEHCYLHDLGAGAIKVGEIKLTDGADVTNNILIDNNIIRSGGYVFPCAVAVTIFNAYNNAVTHNEICDFRYSGVSVGWVWGYGTSVAKHNKIEFNHIHHLGWGELSDMGGVYMLGSSEGTSVNNNVIHHVYAYTYGGWGLYTDAGSTGIIMENNLVYACKSGAFHQHYGKENIIRNNIFANQLRNQLETTKVEAHNSFSFTNNIVYFKQGQLAGIRWDKANFKSDYNCYWDARQKAINIGDTPFKEWVNKGKDTHSIVAEPGFIDPDALNFRLKKNSIVSKIKFKPFDYTQAGVYGDKTWIEQAIINPAVADAFEHTVLLLEAQKIKDFNN
jgi:hypothetical protein